MRKIAFVVTLLTLVQLTGCASHRYYTNHPVRSNDGYNRVYPADYADRYYGQYANLSSPQVPQTSNNYRTDYQQALPQHRQEYAQIIEIRQISETARSNSNGGGAVLGAIIGGILGNQLARNDGHETAHYERRGRNYRNYGNHGNRDAATLGGAIIGGLIGNEVERSSAEPTTRIEITVRYPSGQTQTVSMNKAGNFRTGDWVRLGSQSGQWIIY